MHFLLVFGSSFTVWLLVSSFFEWALHRYVMHRPVGPFVYPFRAHALVHHQIFKADETYHLLNPADRHTIPMAWWNGPVLALLAALPSLPVALALGEWTIYWGAVAGTGVYYCVYEYIHWCMHLPKARRVEKSQLFRRLNGHHLLHHRYMHKNFNVVLPLADWMLGTLMPRAKTRFAQPNNPAVPDVQPMEEEILVTAAS
ncbi:MAG: hypothetical protein RLZZ399_429 [Verrucomicrobiota bacterium]|jgi:hypothetical protein